MATVLTVPSVVRFKPDPHKRLEIADAVMPGLYLIIQPSGVKSWALRYRHAGYSRKLTIGRLPVFDLAEARAKAREALQAIAAGQDPARDKRETRQKSRSDEPARDLVAAQIETFLARYVRPNNKPRVATQVERRLRNHVLPAWGTKRVQDVARRDVVELLDAIVDAGAPATANKVLQTLRTFFNWLTDRSVLQASPCARVKPPAPNTSRDRVLSDDELGLLWRAAGDVGGPFGGFARFLLLTAQRREEVAGLRRSEIKGTVWTIPAGRTKSGIEQDVPLSEAAVRIIAAAPVIGTSDHVFTAKGKGPIAGYSDVKRKLDERILELAAAEGREAPPAWTFHDLRRTAASGMARLGVAVNVIEAVLAHRGGEVSGVAATYNRWRYLPEKRRALELWAAHVAQIAGAPAPSLNRKLAGEIARLAETVDA
jgi:integrase